MFPRYNLHPLTPINPIEILQADHEKKKKTKNPKNRTDDSTYNHEIDAPNDKIDKTPWVVKGEKKAALKRH